MKTSHPFRWAYGGVLVRIDWQSQTVPLSCWDGESRIIRKGDTAVALQTATSLIPIDVEPRRAA